MTLFLAADHAGFDLKQQLKSRLPKDLDLIDLTPGLVPGDDYPLVAKTLAERILTTPGARGIAFCGSAQGICMALNRFRGIRAGFVQNTEMAGLLREHNDANVLCLPGQFMEPGLAAQIANVFLTTRFSGEERHRRRILELDNLA